MENQIFFSGFETGTISSGEKTLKNVKRADKISLIRVPAPQTLKFLPAAVLPLNMGAVRLRTFLTGLTGIDRPEGNTVFFAAHLNNIQQFPVIPVVQSLSEFFCFIFLFCDTRA